MFNGNALMTFFGGPDENFRGTKTGVIHLTNQRQIFISTMPNSEMKSFSAQLAYFADVRVAYFLKQNGKF